MLGLHRHPRGQIAVSNPLGAFHEPPHGPHDLIGGRKAEARRSDQHQQRRLEIEEGIERAQALAALEGVAVGDDRRLGVAQVAEHDRLARDVEVGVVVGVELEQGVEAPFLGDDVEAHVAPVGVLVGLRARRDERRHAFRLVTRQHGARPIDDVGGLEDADAGLIGQVVVVQNARRAQLLDATVEVGRHREHVAADLLRLGLHERVGERRGAVDHRAGALGEPGVHAPGEQRPEQHGDDDGRHDGHQAEQSGEPKMQPRRGVARGPAEEQPPEAPAEIKRQPRDQHQIQPEDDEHAAPGRGRGVSAQEHARRGHHEHDGGHAEPRRERPREQRARRSRPAGRSAAEVGGHRSHARDGSHPDGAEARHVAVIEWAHVWREVLSCSFGTL